MKAENFVLQAEFGPLRYIFKHKLLLIDNRTRESVVRKSVIVIVVTGGSSLWLW